MHRAGGNPSRNENEEEREFAREWGEKVGLGAALSSSSSSRGRRAGRFEGRQGIDAVNGCPALHGCISLAVDDDDEGQLKLCRCNSSEKSRRVGSSGFCFEALF